MPYHVALDGANEARLGDGKVGTTGRGIGPAYGDRAWRLGLRMEDLLDRGVLRERIARVLPDKNLLLASDGRPSRSRSTRWSSEAVGWGDRLRAHLDDTTWLVQAALGARRARPARGRAGHAPRPRPRHLPVRHLVEPGRGRRVHRRRDRAAPGRRGHRRHEGVLDAGRLRAVPDRAPRRDRRRHRRSAATSSGPRPAGRGASAGSTRCRCATRSRSTASAASCSTSSTSCPGIESIRLCVAYEVDGRRVETWPSSGARSPRATPIYERLPGLVRADPRRPLAGRPAGERPALRDRDRGRTPACRSCSCRSGRSGPRRSSAPGGRCATGPGLPA